ncbi:regulator of chromosome condensation 1/beta-lactamase-inhibitor protein II [Collybia nuda]|uniref:Regulator of chromosome condensation 1/beta-lactamase-inhibitor protein II n=1 Tax=Collybia nuda TaxID=64659 RepID=A0A9P5Y0I7_9AGAR|nr:regulator of chromosome condensation 1/beta-lactamase-inhibitor protein II [Collybia nuda]
MPTFAEIPVEVFIDNFLPNLPVATLLRLTCTNKFFAEVCSDDTFWKRKLKRDFNFSGTGTARMSGWKFIYRGLFNPRVYVWGEKSNGRLGLQRFPKTVLHDVPFPTRLRVPNARIVSLAAGGMSFYALDSEGNIYVWGAMDGSIYALNSDGFSEAGKCANTPLRLRMPSPTQSISCGRLHASSLDSHNRVWTFLSWGRPFWLSSQLLTETSSKPIQVECGWGFSCILTQSGDVLVWWPFSGSMKNHIQRANEHMDSQGDKKVNQDPDDVIPCATWDLDIDPVQLPSIPSLPALNVGAFDEDKPTRLVKLAGLDCHIIGLTNKGHVLKFGSLDDELSASRGNWEYLPEYSEIYKVSQHPVFSQSGIEPPKTLHVTHISANFLNFTAYSAGDNSVVLMGSTDTNPRSQPKIIPELQNKDVISVDIGDYHNIALTSKGKVLTWGAYSAGALGLGDPTTLPPGTPGAFRTEERRLLAIDRERGEPPAVEVPTQVRFDHGRKLPKERFCFAIAAAGWHTGALVIDLEPDAIDETDEEAELEVQEARGPSRGSRFPMDAPGQTPPIIPFPGIFRMGHAGRGRGGGFGGFSDSNE